MYASNGSYGAPSTVSGLVGDVHLVECGDTKLELFVNDLAFVWLPFLGAGTFNLNRPFKSDGFT